MTAYSRTSDAGPSRCRGRADHLSDDSLRDDLRWFGNQQRALEAMSARWLAELDRRERQAPPEPGSSCKWWLQQNLHLTENAAYSQLRTAHQLARLPRTAEAFRRGQLSAQHVSVICTAMEQVPATALVRDLTESSLPHAATSMDPFALSQYWQQLRYQGDQEAALDSEEELRERRWLSVRQKWNGNDTIEGELDAVAGSLLKTALTSVLGPRSKDDLRRPQQRSADGLGELARWRLDAGDLPERGSQRPHLTLVAELSTLRLEPGSALARLGWGPLVTGETARRIGCDASVTPVLVNEAGDILHAGRASRFATAALRRALNLRDRHCQGPGCTVPADQCQVHHVRHWADGGATVMPNQRLYCPTCHGRLHPENHRYRRRAP